MQSCHIMTGQSVCLRVTHKAGLEARGRKKMINHRHFMNNTITLDKLPKMKTNSYCAPRSL